MRNCNKIRIEIGPPPMSSDEDVAVVNYAADEPELIAVPKCSTRLLPHATVVRFNLELLDQKTNRS